MLTQLQLLFSTVTTVNAVSCNSIPPGTKSWTCPTGQTCGSQDNTCSGWNFIDMRQSGQSTDNLNQDNPNKAFQVPFSGIMPNSNGYYWCALQTFPIGSAGIEFSKKNFATTWCDGVGSYDSAMEAVFQAGTCQTKFLQGTTLVTAISPTSSSVIFINSYTNLYDRTMETYANLLTKHNGWMIGCFTSTDFTQQASTPQHASTGLSLFYNDVDAFSIKSPIDTSLAEVNLIVTQTVELNAQIYFSYSYQEQCYRMYGVGAEYYGRARSISGSTDAKVPDYWMPGTVFYLEIDSNDPNKALIDGCVTNGDVYLQYSKLGIFPGYAYFDANKTICTGTITQKYTAQARIRMTFPTGTLNGAAYNPNPASLLSEQFTFNIFPCTFIDSTYDYDKSFEGFIDSEYQLDFTHFFKTNPYSQDCEQWFREVPAGQLTLKSSSNCITNTTVAIVPNQTVNTIGKIQIANTSSSCRTIDDFDITSITIFSGSTLAKTRDLAANPIKVNLKCDFRLGGDVSNASGTPTLYMNIFKQQTWTQFFSSTRCQDDPAIDIACTMEYLNSNSLCNDMTIDQSRDENSLPALSVQASGCLPGTVRVSCTDTGSNSTVSRDDVQLDGCPAPLIPAGFVYNEEFQINGAQPTYNFSDFQLSSQAGTGCNLLTYQVESADFNYKEIQEFDEFNNTVNRHAVVLKDPTKFLEPAIYQFSINVSTPAGTTSPYKRGGAYFKRQIRFEVKGVCYTGNITLKQTKLTEQEDKYLYYQAIDATPRLIYTKTSIQDESITILNRFEHSLAYLNCGIKQIKISRVTNASGEVPMADWLKIYWLEPFKGILKIISKENITSQKLYIDGYDGTQWSQFDTYLVDFSQDISPTTVELKAAETNKTEDSQEDQQLIEQLLESEQVKKIVKSIQTSLNQQGNNQAKNPKVEYVKVFIDWIKLVNSEKPLATCIDLGKTGYTVYSFGSPSSVEVKSEGTCAMVTVSDKIEQGQYKIGLLAIKIGGRRRRLQIGADIKGFIFQLDAPDLAKLKEEKKAYVKIKVKESFPDGKVILQLNESLHQMEPSAVNYSNLELYVQSKTANATLLNFTWVTKAINGRKIELQLSFENPFVISQGQMRDELIINQLFPFMKTQDGRLLQPSVGRGTLTKMLPKNGSAQSIMSSASSFSLGQTYLLLFMVILMILGLDASTFVMFIRTLQIMIILRVMLFNYPANASFFMRLTIKIATFDYLEEYDIFGLISDPNAQDLPENVVIENIDSLGMGGYNTLQNLNTVAIAIFVITLRLWIVLTFKAINCICASERLDWYIQKIQGAIVMEDLLTLAIESFSDFCAVIFLWYQGLNPTPDFRYSGEILSVFVAVFIIILCFIILPYYLLWLTCCTSEDSLEEHEEKLGVLWSGLNTETWYQRSYIAIFTLRRLILMISCVYIEGKNATILQYLFLNFMNIFYSIYFGASKSWKDSYMNAIEIANELVLYLVCYFIICFSDIAFKESSSDDLEYKFLLGYVFMGIIGLYQFINLFVILINVVYQLYASVQGYYLEKAKAEQQKKQDAFTAIKAKKYARATMSADRKRKAFARFKGDQVAMRFYQIYFKHIHLFEMGHVKEKYLSEQYFIMKNMQPLIYLPIDKLRTKLQGNYKQLIKLLVYEDVAKQEFSKLMEDLDKLERGEDIEVEDKPQLLGLRITDKKTLRDICGNNAIMAARLSGRFGDYR